jgi:hypothetical protein
VSKTVRRANPVEKYMNDFNRAATHKSKQDKDNQRKPKYGFRFDRQLQEA